MLVETLDHLSVMRSRVDDPPRAFVRLQKRFRGGPRDLFEVDGRLVTELHAHLGEAEGEVALLGIRMHGDRLGVEAEHAAFLRAALRELEHLLEQAMVAEARIDQAFAEVADRGAGVRNLAGKTARDLTVGRGADVHLEQAAAEHLAHAVREVEVVVRQRVAVDGVRAARHGDGVVGRHHPHRHGRRRGGGWRRGGRRRSHRRGLASGHVGLDVRERKTLDDLDAVPAGATIQEAHRIGEARQ